MTITIENLEKKYQKNFFSEDYRKQSLDIAEVIDPQMHWKGAVVCLIIDNHFILIRRSDLMPTHGGQVAMIGGKREKGEDDPWQVAEREFLEETNFKITNAHFFGFLPPVYTARKFMIIPVLAKVPIGLDDFLKSLL